MPLLWQIAFAVKMHVSTSLRFALRSLAAIEGTFPPLDLIGGPHQMPL
jgi:hypothetical protein